MRGYGRHAAGVVVGGVPLVERSVIERRDGEPSINWDKRIVEDFGLVKMDILGLKTLDVLKIAVDHIFKRHGKKVDLYDVPLRSEEHTSELQSLMRISYAVFCLTQKNIKYIHDI